MPPWRPAPNVLPPLAGELHLWRAPLAPAGNDFLLAPDEQARAARLLSAVKRTQFVAGRTLLRTILGRYLNVAPQTLAFAYGEHGKPYLADGRLEFNLAHAGELFLLAVSGCGAVGVDLERLDARLDWAGVAARTFAVPVCTALAAMPAPRQRRAFYRCWTRHEALLKATGGGFAGSAALPDDGGWALRSFVVGAGLLGALATRGKPAAIRRFALIEP